MNNLLHYNYNSNVNKVTYNGENVTKFPHDVKTDPNDNMYSRNKITLFTIL